jgi:hypothetical protein
VPNFLREPFAQKLIGLAAAVGIYWLAHRVPDLKEVLLPLAGVPLGWLGFARPGDVALKDVAQ